MFTWSYLYTICASTCHFLRTPIMAHVGEKFDNTINK